MEQLALINDIFFSSKSNKISFPLIQFYPKITLSLSG